MMQRIRRLSLLCMMGCTDETSLTVDRLVLAEELAITQMSKTVQKSERRRMLKETDQFHHSKAAGLGHTGLNWN